MKRTLVLGIALMAMVAFSAYAQQNCPESDFRVAPVDGGRSVRIVEYVGNNWTVRIPPQIRNLPVTHIGEDAFRERTIIGVTIPNTVTHIERAAFFNNQLTSVTIPNSVIYIGRSAFHTNLLTSITIPDSVTSIGTEAFRDNQLTSLIIPDSVTYIGIGAFFNNQLTSVILGSSVVSIEGWAFASNQLSSVSIPNNVTFIGDDAFRNNQLTSVVISNSVTRIEAGAFSNNHNLQTVTFAPGSRLEAIGGSFLRAIPGMGMGYERVGFGAFENTGITEITIPTTVTSIGQRAFYNSQLARVSITGAATIGANAFARNRLTAVTVPAQTRFLNLLGRVGVGGPAEAFGSGVTVMTRR